MKKGGEISRSGGERREEKVEEEEERTRNTKLAKKTVREVDPSQPASWAARDPCFTEKILPLLRISQINDPKLANLS